MKRIGILGCGDLSPIYLENITGQFGDKLEVAGVCDLIQERAQQRSSEFSIRKIYCDMNEMLADPAVDIVLNLSQPYAHYDAVTAALNAGKHVYTEKPLSATLEEGIKLRELVKAKGLLIGGAPDTFLGAGLQTCRKLIDDGSIGDIVGASAFMICRGHESWHPNPEFYYKHGGGPMMDMGPYYITALVNLLGAVKSVTGVAKTSFSTRTITSSPNHGTIITVDVPTHYTGVMEFENGTAATIVMSFDIHATELPLIEIYGSDGTLSVPDPNTFGGPVRLFKPDDGEFLDVPLKFGYKENSRGLGLYDMVCHLEDNSPFRASGKLLFHVLEVMTGFERAYSTGSFEMMTSRPSRPDVMVLSP